MLLHVVLPGLLWPQDSLREAVRDLPLPALEMLLGRSRRAWRAAQPYEHWLCRAFGVDAEELPCAALRLSGEGLDPGVATWICADPAPVRFARDTLVMGSPGTLGLSAAEAAALVAALNAGLADAGAFSAGHPERWYLRLDQPPHIVTHPLSSVIGRSMEPFLARGEAAPALRRFASEAQVVLHNHPLNAAREAAGALPANNVWFWGAGSLPARAAAPAAMLFGDNPLALGLARLAGVPCRPLPEHADRLGADGDALLLLEPAAEAAQALDLGAWRSALAQAERAWFAPLLAALRSGRLAALKLTALGDDGVLEAGVTRRDLWKFWRRAAPLDALAAPP